VEGSCEHGDEPSGSIKFCDVLEFVAQLEASHIGLSFIELGSLTMIFN
jgi:hypothetical protein